jgi:hypothetical protein
MKLPKECGFYGILLLSAKAARQHVFWQDPTIQVFCSLVSDMIGNVYGLIRFRKYSLSEK